MESFHLYVISIMLIQSMASSETDVPTVAQPYIIIGTKSEEYALPELPYGLADLEPYIDQATVEAHYLGHHDTYRKKMNALLEEWRFEDPINHLTTDPVVEVLHYIDKVPVSRRQKLKNNIGGFVNHAIYWGILSPNPNAAERLPTRFLAEEIEKSFGNFSTFKTQFTQEALNFFGSGYVWLVKNPDLESDNRLSIVTTKNQDSPISQGLDPLLVFDVWEHAYYLKHQFRRANHVNDWWMLVDWNGVEALEKFWIKLKEPKVEEQVNDEDILDFYKEMEQYESEPGMEEDSDEQPRDEL